MMTCDDIRTRGVAEDFLHGRLPPEQREAYERHFFECDACFADLEALRAVREALMDPAGAARPGPARAARRTVPTGWLALAATVVICVGGAVWLLRLASQTAAPGPAAAPPAQSTVQPAEAGNRATLVRLARFDPPPYTPPRLRSPATNAAFDAAMRRYAERDYAGAIPLLRSVPRDSPLAEPARFFLGISLLLDDQLDLGVAVLNALGDDPKSALAEEARFYKARGELLRGNTAAAIAALDRTIALHGDREREARDLRAAIKQAQDAAK